MADPHDQVMSIEAGASVLTNLFDQTPGYSNVFVDMLVQMNPADEIPSVVTNDTLIQAGVFLGSSSNVAVYHSVYDDVSFAFSNVVSYADGVVITNGEWIRLTLTMDYTTDDIFLWKFFKLQINGLAITNANAYSTPYVLDIGGEVAPDGGTWFVCANKQTGVNDYFSSLNLSGSGMFDDVVVTITDPFGVPAVTYTVTVANVVGAWITPTNEQTVASGGSIGGFTILASNGYYIVNLLREGEILPPATSATLSGITSNIEFSVNAATNSLTLPDGVVEEWMQKVVGIYTNDYANAATEDPDADGYTTSEEFLASTDPTNSASVFKIEKIFISGASPKLQWISQFNDSYYLPAYAVYGTTNIVNSNSWAFVANITRQHGLITNEWTASMGTDRYAYYKVVATNAP